MVAGTEPDVDGRALEVARALREIALLLRFHGGNRFRARAYETAADALETLREDLGTLVRARRLTEIPGIGDAIAAAITEIHETGASRLAARLREGVPPGFDELLEVPSLGARKILDLHRALGINDVADLRAAAERGSIRTVPGFGERSERAILEGIRRLEAKEKGHLLLEALEVGTRLVEHLRTASGVHDVALAGSVRRACETVNDVDLVAAADAPAPVLDHLLRFPRVARAVTRDSASLRARLAGGMHVDLVVAPPARFAAALHEHTGSARHVARLRDLAGERRIELHGGDPADEQAIYRRLDLPWIPPELREDRGELEAALDGTLPTDLVEVGHVRGFVHCHTVHSDGKNTIEEMARAAEERGFDYLTITDHSPSASYAGGIDVDQLQRQWDEIAAVQERVRVKLLRGTESDILADGALDYPDRVLEQLDVVIASIHSRMRMSAEQMTRRLVHAMRLPVFKIWGHALGRLIGRRPPFECRVEEVLDAVAESRAAIEINGDPYRLDLAPRWVREARARGIRFVVSTDAHSVRGLDNVRFGVAMARRGWVRRAEVLNTLPARDFQAAVRPAA